MCSFSLKDPVSQSPEKALKIAESGCADEVGPSASPKGDEIHLGGEVSIGKETWSRIQNSTRDSLFVKELAVVMWGTKTLGERSLTGKECPSTLKVCYKEWLRRKNLEDTEPQARWKKAGRFITEKIMDINKQKKKPLQ
ncbi:BEN domain-containing protein 5-like [Micropterus dolomieu]|uniref:BEN domain-containing protein 5-like n=1 Tax=Micropterus dolomieu TaxID=147949 RepID=UPI001E8DE298|nr:BEN domain-containing protein 5-like [Micropterus dolomieu]